MSEITIGTIKEQQVNSYTEGLQSSQQITALSDGGYVITWQSKGQDGSDGGVYLQRYNSNGIRVGSEQQVNSYTEGSGAPQITALNDGGYVIVWHSYGQDGSGYGVYLQQFNSSGEKVGTEQQVNSVTLRDQYVEDVTVLSDGGYVVTWRSAGQDDSNSTSGLGVYLQQFNSNGEKVGTEQQVNTYTNNHQFVSQITALNDGGYVVTWTSYGQDASPYTDDGNSGGIYLQRFNSSGVKVGSEQLVNSYTKGNQVRSEITTLNNGGYVVTWVSDGQTIDKDHSWTGIFLQQFNSNGEKIGTEQQVNTYTKDKQSEQQITSLKNGGYVVTWMSYEQDGSSYGVYLQQFNSNGDKVGSEQQVNSYTQDYQWFPQITSLNDGGYVVIWTSNGQDGSGNGVYLQQYNSNGTKVGIEQQVNSYTNGNQLSPQITALKDGGYVVTWTSDGQDGSGNGVYVQQFNSNGEKVGENVVSEEVAITLQDIRATEGIVDTSDIDGSTLTYTVISNPSHGTLSLNATTGKWSYSAAQGYMGEDSAIVKVSNGQGEALEETLNFTVTVSAPNIASTAISLEEDTSWNDLLVVNNPIGGTLSYEIVNTSSHGTFILNADGSYNYMPSLDYNGEDSVVLKVTNEYGLSTTQTIDLTIIPVNDAPRSTLILGQEEQVNSYSTGNQYSHQMTALKNGGYVVTWVSDGQDGSSYGVYLQQYNSSGAKVGGEQRVNTYTSGVQGIFQQVSALNNGGYVVTWMSDGQDGSSYGVYLQQYNSSGAKVGSEQRVNTYTKDIQYLEDIAALSDGGYVVTWRSSGSTTYQDGSGSGVYMQRFNSSGTKVGAEQRVNTFTGNSQAFSQITALKDGGYVITWSSDQQDGSGLGVYLQQYNSSGAKVGKEQRINSYTIGEQSSSQIIALSDGSYVAIWQSYGQDGSNYSVYIQQFSSSGVKVGTEQRVNSYTAGGQWKPQSSVLTDGGYVITWQSEGQDSSGVGIYLQRFDNNGTKVGIEQCVNSYTTGLQLSPQITALKDGGYVITWQSDGQDGSGYGIYMQQFDSSGAKIGSEQQVNSYTEGSQESPQITALNDGGYVITWRSNGQDGSSYGVYLQQYNSLGEKVDITQTFGAYSGQSTIGDFNYIVDPDGDTLTYTGSAVNGDFVIDSAGKWSYTPNSTFSGTEKVEITIDDGNGGILKQTLTFNVETMTTPLVFDLNHNAITSISLAESIAYFDYDGDGNREHTAWLEKGDAQLVVDVNHDGKITNGSELFGEYTKLPDGSLAKDGYSALAQYDTNNDRVVDNKDSAFSNLLLWSDANQNGISEAGELTNLQQNNIASITLDNGVSLEQRTENGNVILNETSYTNSDGSSGIVRDVGFLYDAVDILSSSKEQINLSAGNCITNDDMNRIIQEMNAYVSDKGMDAINSDTTQNNQDLMQIVSSGWHNA